MGTKKSGCQAFHTVVEKVSTALSIVLILIYIIAFLIQAFGIHDMGLTGWNEFTTLLAVSSGMIAVAHSRSEERHHQSDQAQQTK